MNILEDTTLLFRIAKYYYINNYSQNEIAKIENISRPQISRLLKKARDSGIVEIRVSLPNTLDREELSKKLQQKLNLKKVIISPSTEDEKSNDAGLYSIATSYVNEVLEKSKNVGIGWGKTMYHISLQLTYHENCKDINFYPVIGNSGTNNPYLQTSSITDRFAERFRGHPYYSNTLYLLPKSSIVPIKKEQLAYLRNCWDSLDTVILGIGGQIVSKELYIDEFSEMDEIIEVKEKIMGDVLGNFFLKDLSEFNIPDSYEVVALPFSNLKKINNVICVANGVYKVNAIIYACKKELINVLITDEYTAKAMLEQLEE